MNRWTAGGLALVGLGLVACGNEGGTCTNTFADGADSLYHGTSCAQTAPAAVKAAPAPAPDGCVETLAFGCDEQGVDCKESYQVSCPDGTVLDKTLEPGCRKGPPGGSPVYKFVGDDSLTVESFATNLTFTVNSVNYQLVDPWGQAIERFGELFSNGNPQLSFADVGSSVQNQQGQGNNDFVKRDIISFRIFLNGVVSDFPNAAGITQCGDDQTNGRSSCIESIIMENVLLASQITGAPVQDIANAVALHELGHVACIQHFQRDSTKPSPLPTFTAMNSFFLRDALNPMTNYFTYDSSEVADARQAFADGQTIPTSKFEQGFNQGD